MMRREIASRTPDGSGRLPGGNPRLRVELSLRGERSHHLSGKEGVPGCEHAHGAYELLRRRGARHLLEHQRQVRLGQAGKFDPPAGAHQAHKDGLRLGPQAAGLEPVGRHAEHRRLAQLARDELEREQGVRAGGVDVVKRQEERLVLAGGTKERGEGVEHREPCLLGLRWRRRVASEPFVQLRRHQAEPASAAAEPGFQPLLVPVPVELVDDAAPGPERRSATALPAATPDASHAPGGSLLGEDADEGGLADPGLAGHEHEAATARLRRGQGSSELLQLPLTTHEGGPGRLSEGASPSFAVLSCP